MIAMAMIDELESLVKDAITETFTTMLSLPVEVTPPGAFPANTGLVAASVGFIGEVTGVVYIYSTDALARCVTSKLVGLPEPEIDGHEMVNDAMGELGNMVVGQVKSRLNDRGRKCVLTIPSIVRGQSFSVEPVSRTRGRRVGFRSHGSPIVVEILVKDAE